MSTETQLEFLKKVKSDLGVTWDELAIMSGIAPRALKTYRMPRESKGFRSMNLLAKQALANLLVSK